MRKSAILSAVACVVMGIQSGVALADATTQPADKTALVTQFQSIPEPQIDETKLEDTKYRDEAEHLVKAFNAQRATLAKQILSISPNDTNAQQYLDTVFSDFEGSKNLTGMAAFAKDLLGKTTDALVKRECQFIIALVEVNEPSLHADAPAAVDAFLEANPKDDRVASLLAMAADELPEQSQKYVDRLKKDFAGSPEAETVLAGIWRKEKVGQPFALSFTDAISGQKIDIAQYKGKVVVVDFWATWCGPCVHAMPEMKKTFADYKDKGVVFLGVSLDEPESDGGLTKLKKFVADNQIPWPQYYMGNGWDSEFSKSWKIMSIPCAFVIDAQGNLASVDAFGKLDTVLPGILAKAK